MACSVRKKLPGYLVTPYDTESRKQVELGLENHEEHRETLRELAK